MCEAKPTDEPQPGFALDPDHWLLCPPQQLDMPQHQWVWRVVQGWRHWAKGNASALWPAGLSAPMAAGILVVDDAVLTLQEWLGEKAKREAAPQQKRGKGRRR